MARNIWWISFTAKVPKQKIIEIFEEDPDFIIANGIIYNKELITKEELQNIQKRKEREERIAKGICPECETHFEIGEYPVIICKDCGEMFEVKIKSEVDKEGESELFREWKEKIAKLKEKKSNQKKGSEF